MEKDVLYVALNIPRLQTLLCPLVPDPSGNAVHRPVAFTVGHVVLDVIYAVFEGRKGRNVAM